MSYSIWFSLILLGVLALSYLRMKLKKGRALASQPHPLAIALGPPRIRYSQLKIQRGFLSSWPILLPPYLSCSRLSLRWRLRWLFFLQSNERRYKFPLDEWSFLSFLSCLIRSKSSAITVSCSVMGTMAQKKVFTIHRQGKTRIRFVPTRTCEGKNLPRVNP